MESTFDNSQENITKENLLIEESFIIEDFISNAIIEGRNEIRVFINTNRNTLIKCLGSIKQNYDYFSNIRDALDNIIKKIEELILLSYLNTNLDDKSSMTEMLKCLTGIFELFIILFQYTTNNSFLESFFNMFLKFLKKLQKLSVVTQRTICKHYSLFYARIYNILLEKNIEYIDKLRDSKLSVKVIKIILHLLDKIDAAVYSEEIKILDLFNFLLGAKNNLFALSNDIFLDKVSNLIFKIVKKVFDNMNKGLVPSNHEEEMHGISEIILAKMLEIGKYKDDLKNSINYSQEIFYVNTLILCLRMIKLILQSNSELLLSNSSIKEKLTRVIIELSFWDSYLIVDYTCKLFELLWKESLRKDTGMRSDFQKIIEYMFLRRYQSYYNFLGESENSNIKLSVIEIITKYLNKLIENSDFLIVCYINYDFSKIRFNLVCEIFNALQKYYSLHNPRFTYLKKLITITYLVSCNSVMKGITTDTTEYSVDFLRTYQSSSETWLEVIKLMNNGKFKKFNERITKIFDLKILDKKTEIVKEPQEIQDQYKRVSKAIANLVKYSYNLDINIVYETISDNNPFSLLILEEYCNTFDFRGLDLLRAYEVYVSTFKLYGEPHNIYNFLMHFSKKYFNDNQTLEGSPFVTEDQVSTLAYSILMLNTDLHNPNLTKHMTMEEFIKNNQSTKLFDEFPVEYFRNIYKSISSDPLKVASSRTADYSKSEEIFLVLRSMKFNYEQNKIESNKCNIVTHISEFESPNEISIFNPYDFPLYNLYEDFSHSHHPSKINKNLKTVYFLLWEDLFYNVMSFPYKFYELKDDNSLKVLEQVCNISKVFNQKENIDKLIMTLHSIIISGNFDRRNIVQLYNLFFYISINFSKNFHSYLEIYYEAILNIIQHKIGDDFVTDLKYDYNHLINNLIEKTFFVIDAKKNKRSNSSGIFNYFFGSNKPEVEFTVDQYRTYIQKNFKSVIHKSGVEEIETQTKNQEQDYLIEIHKILDLIKNQDEEFIFFVTLASSKILDFTSKSEFYHSLIFLNEILDANLQEKEFIKIWQNLFNIFRSKMEFKHIFDKEENLFDILYCNYFLSEIMTRFCNVIEVEDYLQILENYQDIENIDVLFYIIENYDRVILNLRSLPHRKIIERTFELVINLIIKLIDHFSQQIVTYKNNYSLQKLNASTVFFKHLIESVKDISILSSESLTSIYKIVKSFSDNNFVKVFSEFLGNNFIVYEVVQMIFDKMVICLPKIDDEQWELFIFILEFCLKSSVTENEEIQMKFMSLNIALFEKPQIPLLKFKEISRLLNAHFNKFITLKVKYENYWNDLFRLFYLVFSNNEELFNSHHDDIENLWNLFIKKVLISFVDFNKKNNLSPDNANDFKNELSKIFEYANNKIKLMNERPAWWDSTKNTVRLYFPDLVKDN